MENISTIDTLWVLFGAALIFFMQAGFALVETGFTRAKNAGNIIMKNLMDFALGSVLFWVIGFGLMMGDANKFIGGIDLFVRGNYDSNIPTWALVAFNTMFCATAATIVSGAMAERTKFSSYIMYSVVISAIIYPIEAHWIWGGGWLSELSIGASQGFVDYAGSTTVHMVGGTAALVGAKLVGPRIGKYGKDGKPRAIPGHSIPLGALGCFILWFCWFGFNPASSYGLSTVEQCLEVGNVFMTTNIAAAAATCIAMIITWIRYGKPDVSMTLNGSLAGLVAITAGCNAVDPWAAAIIGALAGALLVFAIEFFDKVLKIDDPVGAISVHGCCGLFGTLMVGFFARDDGLLTTGHTDRLLIQIVGTAAVLAWTAITMFLVFKVIEKVNGLRVSKEEETDGLDSHEHGLENAYGGFQMKAGE